MRKVAVVARSPSSRYLAPFHDSTWEIWTLSPQEPPLFSDLPRWDRWYELHHVQEKEAEVPGYIEWMKYHGEKVWIREPHPGLPEAQIFPRDEMVELFNEHHANKFTYYNNTVSLCLAHAILEKVDVLGVWGADMCQYSEYGTQRPSCEYFLGHAAGLGIEVHVPDECDLLKCQRFYGLDDPGCWERKLDIHIKEIETKLNTSSQAFNESKKQIVGAVAAKNELNVLRQELNGHHTQELELVLNQRNAFLDKVIADHERLSNQFDAEIKLFTGAREEAQYQKQFI